MFSRSHSEPLTSTAPKFHTGCSSSAISVPWIFLAMCWILSSYSAMPHSSGLPQVRHAGLRYSTAELLRQSLASGTNSKCEQPLPQTHVSHGAARTVPSGSFTDAKRAMSFWRITSSSRKRRFSRLARKGRCGR